MFGLNLESPLIRLELPEDAHPLLREAWPSLILRHRRKLLDLEIRRLEAEGRLLSALADLYETTPGLVRGVTSER
jgi:hypothetical protein